MKSCKKLSENSSTKNQKTENILSIFSLNVKKQRLINKLWECLMQNLNKTDINTDSIYQLLLDLIYSTDQMTLFDIVDYQIVRNVIKGNI